MRRSARDTGGSYKALAWASLQECHSTNPAESMSRVLIRAAHRDDLALLVEIERAAGERFRSLGMDLVEDDDPGSVAELVPYAESGRAFASVGDDDRPVGYLLLDVVDGAHVEQVSVHPDLARQGIGRALIERAATWARGHGLDALTLTTYIEVPWNGPFYERLGFSYRRRRGNTRAPRHPFRERASGHDAWPRACMRLDLRSPA
jgi:GNAT superfamily N-acetyltransferase